MENISKINIMSTNWLKKVSSYVLLGLLGLGGFSQAQAITPYIKAGTGVAIVDPNVQVPWGGSLSQLEGTFVSNDSRIFAYLKLGADLFSANEITDVFAECEINFLDRNNVMFFKNEILPVFFNLGIKAHQNSVFHPYLYGGIGFSYLKDEAHPGSPLTKVFSSKSCHKFSYQIGVGVEYQLVEQVFVDVGYTFSYFGKNKLPLRDITAIESLAHKIHLGLCYEF